MAPEFPVLIWHSGEQQFYIAHDREHVPELLVTKEELRGCGFKEIGAPGVPGQPGLTGSLEQGAFPNGAAWAAIRSCSREGVLAAVEQIRGARNMAHDVLVELGQTPYHR